MTLREDIYEILQEGGSKTTQELVEITGKMKPNVNHVLLSMRAFKDVNVRYDKSGNAHYYLNLNNNHHKNG